MPKPTTLNCSEHTEHILDICTYSFIFILGLIFNLTALVIFFRHSKFKKSPTIVYMTNLAIADLLLILTLPIRIYHHLTLQELPYELCDIMGLILKANMYESIFLLTCICFDRCMAVSFPMTPCIQEGRNKAWLICIGVWIFTFGAGLPIYFSKRSMFSHGTCFDNRPDYAIEPAVVFSTLFVGFGIPLLIMLVCSWGLLRAVRQSIVAQTNLVNNRKIQKMITSSLLIFLLSFLPYHITLTLLFVHRNDPTCPLQAAYHYSLMLACLNTVLDPITYYFTTDTFRKKLDFSENI